MSILVMAVPVFVLTMLIEWRLSLGHDGRGYWLKDTAASLSMGIGNLLLILTLKMVKLALFMAVYEYRLIELPAEAWWVWLLMIPAEDFCYYWYHRTAHEVRLFWAAHVNHHSATSYNLSTALRQSWTSPFYSFWFWLPLPLLGFHPLMMVTAQAISLLYQYWIHTELIEKMGAFEWVFNTPSHHRVHHGSNPKYLDCNHGGILIIWDRLFGTFQEEEERPVYGLTVNIESYNPFVVAFHEWRAIGRDVWGAQTWRGRFLYVFGPPGWREDGTGKLAKDLRREALVAAELEALAA
jgi:sterol desaturase/sphingolipid hydroxylase (fatty acid hydroxylase superfamily)